MKTAKIHFYLLLIGSVVYLIALNNRASLSGSGDPTFLAVLMVKNMLLVTGKYLIFVALVIGHALPGVNLSWLYSDEYQDDKT